MLTDEQLVYNVMSRILDNVEAYTGYVFMRCPGEYRRPGEHDPSKHNGAITIDGSWELLDEEFAALYKLWKDAEK